MTTKLDKNPEVKDLLHKLKRAAPHLLFTARDRNRHYERKRAIEPPFADTVRTWRKIKDVATVNTPLSPAHAPSPPPKPSADGLIPPRVNRGMSAGLVDRPTKK